MKKIFRIRSQEPYYGENHEALKNDSSLLPVGSEYEMEQHSILYLLWLTFMDHGVIPRNLIEENKITSHGDMVLGKIIGKDILICLEWDEKICFKIDIEMLKNIWLEYLNLKRKKADEIILEREGDHFSIKGIWFDKE